MKTPEITPTLFLIIAIIVNIGFYVSMHNDKLVTKFDKGLAVFVAILLAFAFGGCLALFYKSITRK